MSERFFRSSRPGYQHLVCSELEISGIRVAVGDCSVTECLRWHPPYQTGKTVHAHSNTLQTQRRDDQNERGGKLENGRIAAPESIPINHNLLHS